MRKVVASSLPAHIWYSHNIILHR